MKNISLLATIVGILFLPLDSFAATANVGIGTTNPRGILDIESPSTIIMNSGNVGIGTISPQAALDVNGHIANSGAAVTLSSCGSGASITGNDTRGRVMLGGGGITSCTVNFQMGYLSAPFCTATWSTNPGGPANIYTTTTNLTLTISFSTAVGGYAFIYICLE